MKAKKKVKGKTIKQIIRSSRWLRIAYADMSIKELQDLGYRIKIVPIKPSKREV